MSLPVAAGEVVCVAGPSGSGKTALCHLAAGLRDAGRGTVTVDGTPAAEVGDWAMVAVVPSSTACSPGSSVEQNVALPAHARPAGRPDGGAAAARRAST